MRGYTEKTYGAFLKYLRIVINPLKKFITVASCEIHKSINIQALKILKNDKFIDAYSFFSDYIEQLNEGVTWADQDLRSMGHFYNPIRKRGLYGNRDALSLAEEYYDRALDKWKANDIEKSIFYLGAAIHLVQDMAVPQHANIRLLDNHRQYENFIRRTYVNTPKFKVYSGGYYYMNHIGEAVACNARNSIKIYSRLKRIKNTEKRFFTITKFILPLAQRTTAGCMLMFYRDISKVR
ncbi:MAG TPA: phospholipase [Clostridiaceae bacterium]|nr:phospholipase [Clostridiaceae bacterium]